MLYKKMLVPFLLLLAMFTALPAAAADFGLYGFDVRAGLVIPTDWDTGYLVGASANVAELFDGLYLFPAISYSQAEDSESALGIDFDLEVTNIALGAEVRYFPDGQPRGWYFGGGPYLNLVDREFLVGFGGGGRTRVASVDTEEIGITGVAGYQLGAGDAGLLLEGRYSVVSGYDTAQLLIGYSF